jgi:hypothetical protein
VSTEREELADLIARARTADHTTHFDGHIADAILAAGFHRWDDNDRAALAFRNIRARLAEHDMPIHVAADIEQIICEDGDDFGEYVCGDYPAPCNHDPAH